MAESGTTEAVEERERGGGEDLEGLEASVLPAREAMSLISPDAPAAFTPALDATPVTADVGEHAGGPGATTGGATGDELASDAQPSGSGDASVTSDDRSDGISNSDTEVSQK